MRLDSTLARLARMGANAFVLSVGVGGRIATANLCSYLHRYGWSGLIVEASQELCDRIQASAPGRTNVTIERIAIGSCDGEVELLATPKAEEVDSPEALRGMASFIPVRAATLSASYAALQSQWGRPTSAPASRLAPVLSRHGVNRVDVLHVDAGGYEWTILEQVDFTGLRPAVVRVAWSYAPPGERVLMARRLERAGYQLVSRPGELIGLLPGADEEVEPEVTCEPGDIVLYAITYNAPGQLERWLTSVEAHAPELLRLDRKFLLDNSTRPETRDAYDQLAARFGFSVLREGNLGINGGRYFCARHFDQLTDAWGMVWFEDDMLIAGPEPTVCRNGLPTGVPNLLERARAIVSKEQLDYLKLSFSEFFGDHHINWAWYNLPEETRRREFPDGTYRTKFYCSGTEGGLSYLVGEVHYSNWPSLMTRRGNTRLFLCRSEPLFEQHYMADAFMRIRAGELRAGVLLASPIQHDRTFHYPADERKEI